MTAAPTNPTSEPIIGIDLGTTNSLVAICDAAGPRIIPDEKGRHLLPSVVRLDPATGQVLSMGYEARATAVQFPSETLYSIKRLMGRSRQDVEPELQHLAYQVVEGPQQTARVAVGNHVISPQEISARILQELRKWAERGLGRPVRKAVITVPAYFDDAQRQATRDAGRIAGLDVVRIVNEPTAAALAYNIGQRHEDSTVAVFDLGGGTFDISILRLHHTAEAGSVDQVLATDGDTHLGGDDVDQLLQELFRREISQQLGRDLTLPPATRQAMRTLAESLKIQLTDKPSASVEVDLGQGRTYQRTVTRDELEKLVEPWVERALACCRRALSKANIDVKAIERVILVGGATRMPIVRRRVADLFQSEPYTALNPDEVVALGAAVQAAILAGIHRRMLLLDVIPLSLGIETMGGAVAKLIVANQTIPCKATEMFSTYVDGQTNVKIHVLQGERELAKDCRSLGQFDLRGIPPMPAGFPKIEVSFLIDANGILNVSAIEKRSEKSAQIQIVPNHGLTREEVARIEAQSLQHARADMQAHRLIDLRNQARLDMRAIERQLQKVGPLLDAPYRQDIESHLVRLRSYLDAADPDLDHFQRDLHNTNQLAVRLAEVAITAALKEAASKDPGKNAPDAHR